MRFMERLGTDSRLELLLYALMHQILFKKASSSPNVYHLSCLLVPHKYKPHPARVSIHHDLSPPAFFQATARLLLLFAGLPDFFFPDGFFLPLTYDPLFARWPSNTNDSGPDTLFAPVPFPGLICAAPARPKSLPARPMADFVCGVTLGL